MTLHECYEQMRGDYPDILRRFKTEERIEKFLLKLPSDNNYQILCDSLAKQDAAEAFRAAHSLKGIALNLGLSQLADKAGALTESLRDSQIKKETASLYAAVQESYQAVMGALQQYTAQQPLPERSDNGHE